MFGVAYSNKVSDEGESLRPSVGTVSEARFTAVGKPAGGRGLFSLSDAHQPASPAKDQRCQRFPNMAGQQITGRRQRFDREQRRLSGEASSVVGTELRTPKQGPAGQSFLAISNPENQAGRNLTPPNLTIGCVAAGFSLSEEGDRIMGLERAGGVE